VVKNIHKYPWGGRAERFRRGELTRPIPET
jgi:hypothetical protein